MGDDLSVVNAARVSFSKKSDWIYPWSHMGNYGKKYLQEGDIKLIKYLAKHNHWTPFAHNAITLHMKLPIFVQRQMDKHQVGFVVNEVSRRYVDSEPEFYFPDKWRKRPDKSIKQGSAEDIELGYDIEPWVMESMRAYNKLLDSDVAPEMARMVLPQNMYTETWKTGSLAAWARCYKLRADSHAQKEIQEVAQQISEVIEPLFPVSWEALTCM